MKTPCYFDYNATAPIRSEVIDLVADLMQETGNASSVHGFGRSARSHVEKAREQVAAMVGTQNTAVTFTSGATEANNAVLQKFKEERILISSIEHPSVFEVCDHAEHINVNDNGAVDLQAFEKQISEGKPVSLVSVMLVNNETGVIQPVGEIARIARKHNKDVFIHTDASQAPGRIKIDFPALLTDYMSLSAHKFGGPQGVGALISAPGARPVQLLHGGGQEKRQRAGTENVAGIAGMGLAAQIADREINQYNKLALLRDKIEDALLNTISAARIFGKDAERVANTSCIAVAGVDAQTQLMSLDLEGFALSNGSACSSGKVNTSNVLKAMGASDLEANSALRISIGWGTTSEEVDAFIAAWTRMMERMKDKIKTA